MPDFEDAYKTQQVLEAALVSAQNRAPVKVAEVLVCLVFDLGIGSGNGGSGMGIAQ